VRARRDWEEAAMLFAVMGFFRSGIDPSPPELQASFSEHLSQPMPRVRLAGYLLDRDGRRVGFMGLIEAESHERAEAYLRSSPYFDAGLYERTEVMAYDLEVGRLD
jgi:uncharacterized protein YciI